MKALTPAIQLTPFVQQRNIKSTVVRTHTQTHANTQTHTHTENEVKKNKGGAIKNLCGRDNENPEGLKHEMAS